MTGVQHVEATIGEHDALTCGATRLQFHLQRGTIADLARHVARLRQHLTAHLREGNRLRTEHLHLQTCGHVGEGHRLGPRKVVRQRRSERGQHHVTCTRHVVHAARHGGHMHGLHARAFQIGTMTVQREHHGVQLEALAKRSRQRAHLGMIDIGQRLATRRQRGLGAVGRDGGGTGVTRVVGDRRRVDQHGLAQLASDGDHALAQRWRAHALGVVLDADHLRGGGRALDRLQQARFHRCVDRIAALHVNAEHLLRMAMLCQTHDAALHGGGTRGILDETGRIAAAFMQQRSKRGALGIRAGDAEALHATAQRGRAQRHIA